MRLDAFYPYMMVSFLVHSLIAFLVFLIIKITGFLFDSSRFPPIQVQSTVRVDVVAMPDMSLRELKSVGFSNKGWKEKFSSEADDPAVTKILKKKQNSFQNMLKGISTQKVKNTSSKKSVGKKIDGKKLKELVLKGNRLSKSKRITGKGVGDLSGAFALYTSNLPDKIRPFWQLPTHLMGLELQCRIRIFLATDGRLLKGEIVTSSSNEEYDERALSSIKTAAPFDEVPEEMQDRALRGDIILGFPL